MRNVTVKTGEGKFGQSIHVGPHELTGDELPEVGGDDRGPDPFELVLAGLGSCTSMTVKVYADRKGWPLSSVEVSVSGEKRADAFVARRSIRLSGDLTEEQRARLLDIANKCPVHKMLTGKIEIETALVG
ncbi:OsmC family protein [Polyangium jinanense]|uniref:OsmC family protein n=1 Tax=Polyangium jinanense TaxID=2829994 RepID=A0A9X3X7J3_9BACT|nr:OsmC family protein [Polyangium jinanense]MDC3955964.1 OsmC family protein [Polyangium jinanense]MDC3985097.1 OsmC family protein [Polyangium jinanense]